MREFFHGWRRRVGCVTLVMALALMGFWMRSRIVFDRLAHYTRTSMQRLTSCDSMLWLEDRQAVEGAKSHWPGVSFRWNLGLQGAGKYTPYQDVSPTFKKESWRRRTRFAGFDFGEFQDTSDWAGALPATTYRCRVWGIPYWSMVAPLTILSLYLILWKPRNRA
ncbi:MAG: hypothetical protein JWP89_1493 [Schlesneria sp.]|nr:hypothetical protein [Schlesneria sp.]